MHSVSYKSNKLRFRPTWTGVLRSLTVLAWAISLGRGDAAGDDFTIWFSLDNGGGVTTGGAVVLVGSIGQAEAGRSVGEGFTLRGGYIGGGSGPVGVDDSDDLPADQVRQFRFHPVVPNPFNPSTTFTFEMPVAAPVELRIYDLRGRIVRTLLQEPLTAGRHQVTWQGDDDAGQAVASGVYLVGLAAGPDRVRCKIMLVR